MISKLRAVIYIAALAACIAWISISGGALAYLAFFAVLLYAPASWLLALYGSMTLRIWQGLNEHKVTKLTEEDFNLVLENTGFLPINALKMVWEEQLCTIEGIEKEKKYYLKAGERLEMKGRVTCRYAGTYPVGAVAYYIPDAFGIFNIRFKVMQEFRAIVRPLITGAADDYMAMEDKKARFVLSDPRFKEDILGVNLRKYEPGDPLRQIHWKNTARSGELITRLPEDQEVRPVTIVLVPEKPPYEFEDILRRDRFLEFAVSAAMYFGRQNRSCLFIYPHGDTRKVLVDSMASFNKFYEELSDGIYFGKENSTIENDKDTADDNSLADAMILDVFGGGYGAAAAGELLIIREKQL